MQEIILSLISSGGVFSLLTWFITRKNTQKTARIAAEKSETQLKKSELDNTEQAIKIWREIAESLTVRIQSLEEEVRQLTIELKKHK